MPLLNQQLRLTNTADVVRSVSWSSDEGVPYNLAAGRLVVRATEEEEDSVPPLLDVAADLTDPTSAVVVLTKSVIAGVDFPDATAVWEFVVEREDGLTLSVVGGPVVWTRGVARP